MLLEYVEIIGFMKCIFMLVLECGVIYIDVY